MIDTITQIDGFLSNTTSMFFLIIGVWGLLRSVRGQGVDGSYFGALAVGEMLFAVLLVFDVVLFVTGQTPERMGLHYLYALFAVLLLPFLYTSTLKGDDSNRAQWIYTFAAVFLWGIVDRAVTTGL